MSEKHFANNSEYNVMNYSEIHDELKENGLSWTIAAEAIGCSPSHLMNVCYRRAGSRKVAVAVSALIHKDVEEVFPDVPRYKKDRNAERKTKLKKAKAIVAGLAFHSAA